MTHPGVVPVLPESVRAQYALFSLAAALGPERGGWSRSGTCWPRGLWWSTGWTSLGIAVVPVPEAPAGTAAAPSALLSMEKWLFKCPLARLL